MFAHDHIANHQEKLTTEGNGIRNGVIKCGIRARKFSRKQEIEFYVIRYVAIRLTQYVTRTWKETERGERHVVVIAALIDGACAPRDILAGGVLSVTAASIFDA